jgi:peptidoglycan hydrolase CwlO-like protein
MTDFKDFFEYIFLVGGGVIAYFIKNVLKGIKDQEKKIEEIEGKVVKLEGKIYLVDSQTSSKIEKLEELSKVQFNQLHVEINDLKNYINNINVNIQELIKSNFR